MAIAVAAQSGVGARRVAGGTRVATTEMPDWEKAGYPGSVLLLLLRLLILFLVLLL